VSRPQQAASQSNVDVWTYKNKLKIACFFFDEKVNRFSKSSWSTAIMWPFSWLLTLKKFCLASRVCPSAKQVLQPTFYSSHMGASFFTSWNWPGFWRAAGALYSASEATTNFVLFFWMFLALLLCTVRYLLALPILATKKKVRLRLRVTYLIWTHAWRGLRKESSTSLKPLVWLRLP